MKIENENRIIKCSTGEIANSYSKYLQTDHWKSIRLEVAEKDNYTCARCLGVFRDSFVIHHNTYKRLGNEDLKDLTLYCNGCHTIIHKGRDDKKQFNKQYNNIIKDKLRYLSEEDIEDVLEYIDLIVAGDPRKRKLKEKREKKKRRLDKKKGL